jgi:hypothetical protein
MAASGAGVIRPGLLPFLLDLTSQTRKLNLQVHLFAGVPVNLWAQIFFNHPLGLHFSTIFFIFAFEGTHSVVGF